MVKKLNPSGNVVKQLSYGQDFRYHISTINGNVSNIPAGINDNFGGCLKAPLAIILPVKLMTFAAVLNATEVDIQLATASEKNVSHFIIEKSIDGYKYYEIGLVFAKGNSSAPTNYSLVDRNIVDNHKGVIYYRIRFVDLDGKDELSHIRSIRFGKPVLKEINVAAYPNPFINEVRITVPANWQNKKICYEVYNNMGQVALKNSVAAANQTESLKLFNLTRGLHSESELWQRGS